MQINFISPGLDMEKIQFRSSYFAKNNEVIVVRTVHCGSFNYKYAQDYRIVPFALFSALSKEN